MINIKINGENIQTEAGKTILEVAKENNIKIPTLCTNIREDYSCGLCVVNVVGKDGLVDSCKTKVEDGMKIFTDSRTVRTARKLALELILSDHYADCVAPCNLFCPLGIDIQSVISFVRNKMLEDAILALKEQSPLPLTLSKICNAFCENVCRRSIIDRPVEIQKILNFVANYAYQNKIEAIPKRKISKKQKIAIIGAGISGLSCGYFLSLKGFQTDIYEALPEAGGLLKYAIPEFKLSRDILKYELDLLLENGINMIPNTKVGVDISLKEISNNYDAVYIATGLQKSGETNIKNFKKTKTILLGMDFLKKYHLGQSFKFGKNVIIYGNNDIAINCARIIKRMELDVAIYFDGEIEDFNADKKEIRKAKSEGITFFAKHKALEIKKEKGKIKKIVFEKYEKENIRKTEKKTDIFILASEPQSDLSLFPELTKNIKIKFNPNGSLRIDENSLYSGISNIFIGGDLRYGRSRSATLAIADGKKAAASIENFLLENNNEKLKEFYSITADKPENINPILYKYYDKKIVSLSDLPQKGNPNKNSKISIEPEHEFTFEEIQKEASLCLECGCKIVSSCKLKKYAEDYKININNYSGEKNVYPIDNRHPFITFDANKCIKCGNCVEECMHIQGAGILGFIYKGFKLTVAPEFGKALTSTECLSCGKCIEVCPTSALFEKNINYFINTFPVVEHTLNCGLCSLGCEIIAYEQNGKVMKIKPSENDFNKNNLCFEGKFGWQVFENNNRIKLPQIRVDKTNDWQEEKPIWKPEKNLTKIAKIIKSKIRNMQRKAIYIGPTATIEEVLLLKEIAKKMDAEISSFFMEKTVMDKFYNTIYTEKKYSDLKKAKVIVLVGEIPLVLKSVLRTMQKLGKKIIIINQEKNAFNDFADILLDSAPINNTLEKIIEYNNLDCNCADIDCNCEAEDILPVDLPPQTMFIYNKFRVSEQTMANILRLSYQICSEYKEGSGIFEISDFINAKGFIRMNIKKYSLQISDFVLLYGAMPNSEQLKWLEKSKFVISVDTHLEDENIADIFIPRPDYLSMNGTALADGSRIVKFKNVKKEKYFENILHIFKNAGLLNKEQSKPDYWLKKAEELIDNLPEPKVYDENHLAEIIESIEDVNEKVSRYYPVYYFEINKLKNLTKGKN